MNAKLPREVWPYFREEEVYGSFEVFHQDPLLPGRWDLLRINVDRSVFDTLDGIHECIAEHHGLWVAQVGDAARWQEWGWRVSHGSPDSEAARLILVEDLPDGSWHHIKELDRFVAGVHRYEAMPVRRTILR